MVKEFRDFLMRGNIIDLAVAVVIGAAFGVVVTSLVDNIIMPIIGIFGGSPNFSGNTSSINGSVFGWGAFLTAVISFILIAAAVFFVVVKPMNALTSRLKKPVVPAAKPGFEYRTAAQGDLNKLGADGWELVGVSNSGFFLKRAN